jgi:2-aminobenzoate-CoA ligase
VQLTSLGFREVVRKVAPNVVNVANLGEPKKADPLGRPQLVFDRETDRKYVQHGWNLTGDAYRQDDDGYFWYQARTDDMIVTSGYNVSGVEIENVLLAHPAVAECAVVGIADEARGQIVKAFVVLRSGQEPTTRLADDLQAHVKAVTAPYKYPREIEFVDALPKTPSGKIQRFLLRDRG